MFSPSQVQTIKYPNEEELNEKIIAMKPNCMYLYGGVPDSRKDLETKPVSPLRLIREADGKS